MGAVTPKTGERRVEAAGRVGYGENRRPDVGVTDLGRRSAARGGMGGTGRFGGGVGGADATSMVLALPPCGRFPCNGVDSRVARLLLNEAGPASVETGCSGAIDASCGGGCDEGPARPSTGWKD